MIVSRKEFAGELNVTLGRVSQYAKRGMPTVDGGVDRDAAMTWVRSHITPQAGIHSHKGADRAYELLHGGDHDDVAIAAAESVLAPLANEIMQELARLGARVAAKVRDLDDPDEIKAIAVRELKIMLLQLPQLVVGHE